MNARIQLKIDTEQNWYNNAETFIPRAGEMIIYSPDENHSVPRLKVGNGEDYLESLPFTNDELIMKNGTASYWKTNKSYIPKAGEIIVITSTSGSQLKVGDGSTTVENLNVYGGTTSSGIAQKLADASGNEYNVGDENNFVYFENGVPVSSNYYIWKTVPSDAQFTDTTYTAATTSTDGLLSKEDKATLDSLASDSVLKTSYASANSFGIVKIGENISIQNGVISVADASGTEDGIMAAADKTKLDTIESGAQKNVQTDWNATVGDAVLLNKPTLLSTSLIGEANGIAGLDENGKVPQSQLPSYVDDVLEYEGIFPTEGETGKIYVDTSTNKTYRWSGTQYVEISESLALGTTSSTAFAGDKGQRAYEHAGSEAALGEAKATGLYKMGVNTEGHITSAVAATKEDLTALGIPAQDTTYSTFNGSTSGLVPISSGEDNKYLAANGEWQTIDTEGVKPTDEGYTTAVAHANNKGTAFSSGLYKITTNSEGHVIAATAISKSDITNLGIPAQDTTYTLPTASSSVLGGIRVGYSASGKNYAVALDSSGNAYVNVPWSDTNTTYGVATTSTAGLMSANDKSKLDGIASGANNYTYTLPTATTSTRGGVILSTSTSSSDTTGYAATPSAVKAAYDLALSAYTYARNYSYTLSAATSSALGGVMIGYTTSGKNYAVQLDSSNRMYVNVPWTDTTSSYTLPTASSTVLGGVMIGSNISISNGTISLSKTNITDALGYTPADSTGSLKNPYSLTITAGTTSVSYDGSAAKSITVPKCYVQSSTPSSPNTGDLWVQT